jgi:type I site-specific restriction endonuclease
MTPEQLQQALQMSRLDDSYNRQRDEILAAIGRAHAEMVQATSRDEILAAIGRAHAEMVQATSRDEILAQSVNGGELAPLATKHAAMQQAMAGQDAEIQAAFETCIATLENAQAVVYGVTDMRFIHGIPLPPQKAEAE